MRPARFALTALLGMAQAAHAACPAKPVPLCTMVAEHPVVVRARVVSTQTLADADDPQGVAAWVYHLDVVRDYRHGKPRPLAVVSENTTSRVNLETGKEYVVFAAPTGRAPGDGKPVRCLVGPPIQPEARAGNHCLPAQWKSRKSEVTQQVA